MKRCICILLIMTLIAFCGCSNQEQAEYAEAAFYYCTDTIQYDSDNGVFASENRKIDQNSDNITTVINAYLSGPLDDELISPFPSNASVVDFAQNGKTATITLSRHFARLTGIDLTVACSCITLTLNRLLGVDCVVICADELQLDGKTSVTMHIRDVVLWDDATAAD